MYRPPGNSLLDANIAAWGEPVVRGSAIYIMVIKWQKNAGWTIGET
jgi:hypothetical protein